MTVPIPNYAHKAHLALGSDIPPKAQPVHDGDTFFLRLDLGVYGGVKLDPVIEIRLQGIDCWEVPPRPEHPLDPGYSKGYAAQTFTINQLTSGKPILAQTVKPDLTPIGASFTRTAALVWIGSDNLADLLRSAGFEKVKS